MEYNGASSRRQKTDTFLKSKIWLSGPAYFLHSERDWPVNSDDPAELMSNDPEVKVAMNVVQTSVEVDATTQLIHNFSSWT